MNKIPKILHLYWDRSPMSLLQTFTVTSFHKLNPDWEINLYIPKQPYRGHKAYIPSYTGENHFNKVEQLPYVNIHIVDLNDYGIALDLHNILRSDILRYNILYEQGGVWSDFDVLWLKPMEHFNNIEYYGDTPIEDVNAVVSFIHGTQGGHSIGILMHCKNDPYMASVIELTKTIKPPYTHEVYGSGLLNKHYPTLESIQKFPGVIGAKFETYYPYNIHPHGTTIHLLYNTINLSLISNNVMCLHWYNGHVLSKNYINSNGFNRPCSMTKILTDEGYI